MVPIATFTAHNDRHLYAQALKVDWSKYLNNQQRFVIESTTYSERFRHSRYAALKVKDAIADQFRNATGDRPSVDLQNPDIRFNLHIAETTVTIYLDSSGESLEKRGYRTESNEAPISEVLAAALVLFTGWDTRRPLLDPMTGSGTIAIEAAMLAQHIPPGMHRSFAFQKWSDYDPTLFNKVLDQAKAGIQKNAVRITARDINMKSLAIAKRNAERANVVDHIDFDRTDFTESSPLATESLIIINPPYGERLEEDNDMEKLYHEIGFRLKHHYPNHTVWVISSNLPAMKRIGLKPEKRIKLYNGPLECRFNEYRLFKGKRIDQLRDR